MECFVGFRYIPSTLISRPKSIKYNAFKRGAKTGRLRTKLDDENDPLLQAAISAASLRFQETFRPEPLFLDPYAGCFVPHHIDIDKKQCSLHYLLATKFIDDKLLDIVNQIDGLKQVVLLTDSMDTRPYRLSWPTSTIIFDVSADRIFKTAAEKLEDVGAKMPKGCLFRHVPLESSNLQQSLCAKGFNGNLPSVWAIQGLPLMTLSSFGEILLLVSGLATNGCFFLGELPAWLAKTDTAIKVYLSNSQNGVKNLYFFPLSRNTPLELLSLLQYGIREWMEKVFMSNGFRVNMISHDEVARSFGKSLTPENYNNMLFLAEQLRCSDDQMETWRREFQRVEEEGDEEGFEEL